MLRLGSKSGAWFGGQVWTLGHDNCSATQRHSRHAGSGHAVFSVRCAAVIRLSVGCVRQANGQGVCDRGRPTRCVDDYLSIQKAEDISRVAKVGVPCVECRFHTTEGQQGTFAVTANSGSSKLIGREKTLSVTRCGHSPWRIGSGRVPAWQSPRRIRQHSLNG